MLTFEASVQRLQQQKLHLLFDRDVCKTHSDLDAERWWEQSSFDADPIRMTSGTSSIVDTQLYEIMVSLVPCLVKGQKLACVPGLVPQSEVRRHGPVSMEFSNHGQIVCLIRRSRKSGHVPVYMNMCPE